MGSMYRGLIVPILCLNSLSLLLDSVVLAKPGEAKKSAKSNEAKPILPPSISIMAYNVENLFDTEHDAGKNDWTYLPASAKSSPEHKQHCKEAGGSKTRIKECEEFDWSEQELKVKLERIARIVLSINGGKGPDILFLEEIENVKVLERLRSEYLKDAAYKPGILLEGDDARGIDPAILSRFEQLGPARLHTVDFIESRRQGEEPKTRGILQADFKLPSGGTLTAFGVHFPAPYHPFLGRQEVMETLTNLARAASVQAQIVIAGGDFNTNSTEDSKLYRAIAAKDWHVSHLEGCKQCLGTHYFRGQNSWSFLDAIMLHKSSKATPDFSWTIDADSVQVLRGFAKQMGSDGLPLSWEGSHIDGISDHLPLTLNLKAWLRP